MSENQAKPMTAHEFFRVMREEARARQAFLDRLLDPATPEAEVDQACKELGVDPDELRRKARLLAAKIAEEARAGAGATDKENQ